MITDPPKDRHDVYLICRTPAPDWRHDGYPKAWPGPPNELIVEEHADRDALATLGRASTPATTTEPSLHRRMT
jgi:hypothetical protein